MKFKNILILLALASISLVAETTSIYTVNNLDELLINNPNSINTNALVVSDKAIYQYDINSSAATNTTDTFKPYNFGGRWLKWASLINSGGTNIFSTIIVTNVTVIQNITIGGTNVPTINPTLGMVPYKSGTNSFGDTSLTNVDSTTVEGNQLIMDTLLRTDGSLVTSAQTGAILSAGTNVVNTYHKALIYLISGDPTAVVKLTTGNGAGSHVWLVNALTNSSFSLPSGPLDDDPSLNVYIRGGVWSPTQVGESLELLGVGGGWDEIGRSNPNGGAPVTTNYWQILANILQPTLSSNGLLYNNATSGGFSLADFAGVTTLTVTNATGGHALVSIDSTGNGAKFLGGSSSSGWGIADGTVGLTAFSNNKIVPLVDNTTDLGTDTTRFVNVKITGYLQYSGTNSTPVTTASPFAWIQFVIQGDASNYRIPIYK